MQPPAQSSAPTRPSRLSLWLVALVVLALAAVRSIVAFETDLVADEAYYTHWSLFLSPGYLDHPPAIAWLIALGRWLVGENSLGVRFVALLAPVIISLALYRTGTLLADRGAALLAVLWYNLSIGLALSLLATPDVPSTLFWMLASWAVAEFMASRNANWWLAVGLFAGLGVLGKYTNLFFGVGILALILSSRERWGWLKLWQLWAGGALAALVVAPNLLWNAENGWISFTFQGGRIARDPAVVDHLAAYLELVGAQALFLGPVTVLAFFAALVTFLIAPKRWPGLAWPVLSILPALVYFGFHAVFTRVEANWLLPLWPMATLAAALVVLRGLRANLLLRILRGALVLLQIFFGLAVVAAMQWIVFTHPPGLEHLDRTRDMRGWTEVAEALDALADANGAGWIAVPPIYGTTGHVVAYSHFIGSDRPVHALGDRGRYPYERLNPATLQFPALIFDWTNGDPEAFAGLFGDIEMLGDIERTFGEEVLARYQVLLVDDPTPAFLATMHD